MMLLSLACSNAYIDWLVGVKMLPLMSAQKCLIACNSSGGSSPWNWIAVARVCMAFTILLSRVTVGLVSAWCLNLNVLESLTAPDSVTLLMTQ